MSRSRKWKFRLHRRPDLWSRQHVKHMGMAFLSIICDYICSKLLLLLFHDLRYSPISQHRVYSELTTLVLSHALVGWLTSGPSLALSAPLPCHQLITVCSICARRWNLAEFFMICFRNQSYTWSRQVWCRRWTTIETISCYNATWTVL